MWVKAAFHLYIRFSLHIERKLRYVLHCSSCFIETSNNGHLNTQGRLHHQPRKDPVKRLISSSHLSNQRWYHPVTYITHFLYHLIKYINHFKVILSTTYPTLISTCHLHNQIKKSLTYINHCNIILSPT